MNRVIKQSVRITVVFMVMISLVATLVPPVAAQTGPEEVVTVAVDGLLVYEQPNPESRLLAVYSLGASITRFPQDVQNEFTRVRLPDGRLGWAQFGVTGAPTGAPTTGDGSQQAGAPTSSVIVEARGNVRLRDAPTQNSAQLGLIPWGEQAQLLGRDDSGNWGRVNFEGTVGWVALTWFVTVSGDASAVAETTEAAVADTSGGATIVQAVGNVLIRDEPSQNSARITLVPWGDTARLLGTDDSGNWARVEYGDIIGWSAIAWWRVVSGDVTTGDTGPTADADTTELPSLPGTDAVEAPAPTGSVTLMAVGNLRVRETPSLNGAQIGSLGWGEMVTATALSSDGNWVFIVRGDLQGWAARDWFSVESGNISSLGAP